MQRILGLDPGYATLGFGVIDCISTEDFKAFDFGVITTPAGMETGDRLSIIYDDLTELVSRVKPDLASVEELFFYKMGNTIGVAQARGVIVLVLAQLKVPMVSFTPSAVKLSVSGNGNAGKKEMQEAVRVELGLEKVPKPDDAADAVAIALTALRNQ